jgi:hypothetical protein
MNTHSRSFFRTSISLLGLAFGGEMLVAQGQFELHPPEPAEHSSLFLLQPQGSFPQGRQSAPERDLQPGETISVAELRLPAAAVKELRKSLKRFYLGDVRDSAKHLEKALRIDDTIPVAHYNLGICYGNLGRLGSRLWSGVRYSNAFVSEQSAAVSLTANIGRDSTVCKFPSARTTLLAHWMARALMVLLSAAVLCVLALTVVVCWILMSRGIWMLRQSSFWKLR